LIVRRGAAERFRLLSDAFAREPVQILWDRRAGERRRLPRPVAAERRARARRGAPAPSWDALDFAIARL
jgi:hypothetical protein